MRKLATLLGMTIALCAFGQADSPDSSEPIEIVKQVLEHGATALDPVDIMAWVEMPRTAKVGETVQLKITIENGRKDQPFQLESIDLGGGISSGFEVQEVQPTPIEQDVFLNELTLEYAMLIPPGSTAVVQLELIAKEAGVHIGDVDIWDQENFLTRVAQCRVTN